MNEDDLRLAKELLLEQRRQELLSVLQEAKNRIHVAVSALGEHPYTDAQNKITVAFAAYFRVARS